MEQTAKKTRKT